MTLNPMSRQTLTQSNIQDIYPLTPLQEGMYFHYLQGQKETYCCQMSWRVRGKVRKELVGEAFQRIFHLHPVLKTICISQGDKIMGVVLNEVLVKVEEIDISGHAETTPMLARLREEDRARAFQLDKELSMRLTLVTLAPDSYEFIWTHHHIIMDGWSLGILVNDFYTIYDQLGKGLPVRPPARSTFMDFLQWMQQRDHSLSGAFWQNYLSGYRQPVFLGVADGVASKADAPYKDAMHSLDIDADLVNQLQTLAAGQRITLNTIVQAAWGITLCKIKKTTDVVFGAVVSGRPSVFPDVEHIVGLFIATIPVRVRLETSTTFRQLMADCWKALLDSENHQYYHLADIQVASSFKAALFDHLLVFENYPVSEQLADGNGSGQPAFDIEAVEVMERTNYDLTALVSCRQNDLKVEFRYNASRHDASFIRQLGVEFATALTELTHDIDRPVHNCIELPVKEMPEWPKEPTLAEIKPVMPPRDEVERELRNIWSAILSTEETDIDIQTDLLYYGGHSLKAIRICSLIQKRFDIRFSPGQIFSNPTIEGLAKEIKAIQWARSQPQSGNTPGLIKIKI